MQARSCGAFLGINSQSSDRGSSCGQIEIPTKLLDYFLWSNKTTINHVGGGERAGNSDNFLIKMQIIEVG